MIPIFSAILGIIDKIVPDTAAAEKAKLELAVLRETGELQLMLAQANTNLEEAKHASIFVAGWRPFIGWIGGFGLCWAFVVQPMITYLFVMAGVEVPPMPEMHIQELLSLVMALLGVAGMRTYEKFKGVHRDSL